MSTGDRHHFDNPVYSFGPANARPQDPLNNLIRNDLKSTNLQREKLSYGVDDSEDDYIGGMVHS